MTLSRAVLVGVLAVASLGGSANAAVRQTLSFEERVACQEAIEHVYYRHRLQVSAPFEEQVSREILERKVRRTLRETLALDGFWATPVTQEMLQAELARIARQTRFPDRLVEIYAALGNEPIRVEECLARPVLVHRLAHNFFLFDPQIHSAARQAAADLRASLAQTGHEPAGALVHSERKVVRRDRDDIEAPFESDESQRPPFTVRVSDDRFLAMKQRMDGWPEGISPVRETPTAFRVEVLTDEDEEHLELITFSIFKQSWPEWWSTIADRIDPTEVAGSGALPAMPRQGEGWLPVPGATEGSGTLDLDAGLGTPSCLPDDTWDNGSLDDVPDQREGISAVWTGNVMIVWGGSTGNELNSGARYDPLTDTWAPTSTTGAPEGRYNHAAVWTGTRMLVWGGVGSSGRLSTGGSYDPLNDTWTPISGTNAPAPYTEAVAVWTGEEMLVWGGLGFGTPVGGRYVPATDTWLPITAVGEPSARVGHTGVWTGSEMVIWGGEEFGGTYMGDGARYDPMTDTWTPVSPGPQARGGHSAVWTGSRMLIWGGAGRPTGFPVDIRFDDGWAYDPGTGQWSALSGAGAPSERTDHQAIWTGDRMLIWGGANGSVILGDGGGYDPTIDSWSALSTVGAPRAASSGESTIRSVWTGELMIVWGLFENELGGRYDPTADSWTPISRGSAPEGREGHAAVWTGSEMIVWGGRDDATFLVTGGSYDPTLDTWSPISDAGAPEPRSSHAAIWTGERMVVWGGVRGPADWVSTGGQYSPIADLWTPTSTVGAPETTAGAIVFAWTGQELIVWSGEGGRYDPANDIWLPLSDVGAPTNRSQMAGVWTGESFVIWGGSLSGELDLTNTGVRYDPELDTWTPISDAGAPEGRIGHAMVWTGDRMVVWGGRVGTVLGSSLTNTGGSYDPVTDTWEPMSTVNAPSLRTGPLALSTGSYMFVWGGYPPPSALSNGARYDPLGDVWTPIAVTNSPLGRERSAAIWTGGRVILWGGRNASAHLRSGGAYALSNFDDVDEDGFTWCEGDCDDRVAVANPMSVESCDGIDNDCDGTVDGFVTECGVGGCARSGSCVAGVDSCVPGIPSGEICDGIDDDCDGALPAEENDADMDGSRICDGDCDDEDGARFPGNPEICDGIDNDCNANVDDGPDSDGDLTNDVCDCDPGDATLIAVPSEVSNVALESSPPSLLWADQVPDAGSGTVYDVIGGLLSALAADGTFRGAQCVALGLAATTLADSSPTPPPGDGFYAQVRARNGCGVGSFGNSAIVPDPRDALDAASSCP